MVKTSLIISVLSGKKMDQVKKLEESFYLSCLSSPFVGQKEQKPSHFYKEPAFGTADKPALCAPQRRLVCRLVLCKSAFFNFEFSIRDFLFP